MLWILVISSLNIILLRGSIADSTCSNATNSPMSPFLFADEILLKLSRELDLMKISDEILRLRLEAMSLRLERQTQLLEKITSKLGINSTSSETVDGSSNGNANKTCHSNIDNSPQYPRSCEGAPTNDIALIQVPSFSAEPFLVYCNAEDQGGNWTVIQRRVDGSVDFYRDWTSYKRGFGNLYGNFFIGLDKLHAMTTAEPQELWIWLSDFENITKYARYDGFAIGNESEFYALNVLGKYSGDAGDSFTYQQGMKFTTKDKQNDNFETNCAVRYQGAWWYNACHASNLNGLYLNGPYPESKAAQGIDWESWHGHFYSLKTVSMMIRPKRK